MNQKASFNNELFIVLMLKGEVRDKCETMQKEIAEHYNLYEGDLYPELHITLNRIHKEKLNRAVTILNDLSEKFTKIKIELDGFSCYRQLDGRFLVLEIKENESLRLLGKELHGRLIEEGISTVENFHKWKYHITILSNIFAKRPINNLDFESLCFFMEGDKYRATSLSDTIEIWSPVNNPEKKRLYSFNLGSKTK
ncbi:2'-5' RNA ligase family protein [Natronospora cellulosivora (SeqCode)]